MKAALLMTVLLLSAVWVVAQTAGTAQPGTETQPSSPTGASPQSGGAAQNPQSQTTPSTRATGAAGAQTGTATQTTPERSQTIEGCLSGIPGQYSLITKSGQVYSLSGDDSLLGNHVGQVVRATGAGAATNPATPGQAQPGAPAAGSGPRFQVSNLTKISAGCKMVEPH